MGGIGGQSNMLGGNADLVGDFGRTLAATLDFLGTVLC